MLSLSEIVINILVTQMVKIVILNWIINTYNTFIDVWLISYAYINKMI